MNKKIFILVTLVIFIVTGCAAKTEEKTIDSLDDIRNMELTVAFPQNLNVGAQMEELSPLSKQVWLEATEAISSFNANKIDAYVHADNYLKNIAEASRGSLKMIDEPIETFRVAFAIDKNSRIPDLENRVNEFVKEGRDKGLFTEIYERWQDEEHDETMKEVSIAKNPEFTLVVGTVGINKPFCYYKDNVLTGADIEIVYHLAAYLNAEIRFEEANYQGIIAGITSGKYDILAANLFITEERAKAILFSDPYYDMNIKILVKNNDKTALTSVTSFADDIKAGFKKTFIDENRYLMILSGIKVTIIITVFGFVLANVLGALICAMSMSAIKFLKVIASIYSKLMQGTPIVVILMITYYVIFGKSNISNVIVAIISFGISTAAYIAQIYEGAIRQVAKGEIEAALALGLKKSGVFTGIILPQAIRTMMPALGSQLVGLMKGTAVVGYIAVMDMTKVSDIIRSSTYEAFFPLLSIAFIYFLISLLILLIVDRIIFHLDPANKKKEIKGI